MTARMTAARATVAVTVILTAFIVQVTLLSRIGLPGATPDLVLVVLVLLAMAAGPANGAILGFGTGVLVDVAPPAAGSVGQTAAIYALVGFGVAMLGMQPGPADWPLVASIGAIGGAVSVALALTSAFIGNPEVMWSALPVIVVTQAVYCALLAALLSRPIGAIYRGAVDEGRLA